MSTKYMISGTKNLDSARTPSKHGNGPNFFRVSSEQNGNPGNSPYRNKLIKVQPYEDMYEN